MTKQTMPPAKLVKIILCIPAAFIITGLSFALPKTEKAQAAEFKIHCMNRIMYSANKRRSEISENAASNVCQNASTAEQSVAIGDCFKDTLYNSSNQMRDGMTISAAATVCQRANNKITSQKISKCMTDAMYQRGRLRPGITAQQAVNQCSSI